MMKKIIVVVALTLLVLSCKNETKKKDIKENSVITNKKNEIPKKKVLSPHTETMAIIGDAHIHIDYSSPGVRGRIIFGGLVGYDNVWQAGAQKATYIETNKDLIIDGKTLPAGKYGFFIVPTKDDWTIMINKNWNQHGKDEYNQDEDVIRFKVIPIISAEIKEHLEYKISKISETEGSISLHWEKVKISFPFTINQ